MVIKQKLGTLLLTAALLGGPAIAFSQSSNQDPRTPRQDMHDAGQDAKQAAKDTGHATKKTTRKAYNKTKRGTKKAYNKTKDTTKGAVDGAKEGARQPE